LEKTAEEIGKEQALFLANKKRLILKQKFFVIFS